MARLMQAHDWSGTAVGAPRAWPQSLRSVVNLMLGSGFPMFVAWGPDLEMLYNDAYAEILGSKHPASLGTGFEKVWHDILDDIMPFVQRAMAGETFLMENLPLRMQRRGAGEEDTWFTFSYSPVQDEEGHTAGIYCACTETTATVLAAQHQRAEQERLQGLFQQAPGILCVTRGPEHVFEVVNPGYLRHIGDREVLGRPVRDALPEVVDQGYVDLLDDVYRSGRPYVGRSARVLLNLDGSDLPTEAFVDFVYQPLLDAHGRVYGIFTYGHDVTGRQRAQEALLAFSNSIPAIAWEASPAGKLERFNSQWEAFTGQPEARALGYGWAEALHPDDAEPVWRAWKKAREDGKEWTVEHRLRHADGSWRWFLTRAVPQKDSSGRVLHWFGTTTDIEDARRAAQALRTADRQKDEFLATLAHELRNPLAPIRTAVHLLSMPAVAEPVRTRAVQIVERQVSHMARLLDDLIDVARITQRRLVLKRDWVQVQAIVDTALEAAMPVAERKRHALTTHVEQPQQWLHADPVRLAQVLSNILNNACKYTDAGGRIQLDVSGEDGWIVFSVTDNGIGMGPEALHTVFHMFAQEQSALERSEGGLGIGLGLAKGLVELHGGTISASSPGIGGGSRFEVRLPVSAHPGQQASAPPAAEAERTSDQRSVLLADDNIDAVEVLAEVLRMAGHEVHLATEGTTAAAMAARLQPRVLVLDIGMPGLNGYEVARQVRAQFWGRRALLIAATGWGQEEDRRKAQAAGFDLHLTKPFSPEELLAAIDAAR
jgi:PAS domain S-box-containing protein